MKVLLIQPRPEKELEMSGVMCFEPLGLENIAALLEKDNEIKLVDLFEFEELAKTLFLFKPEICGISCSFVTDVNRTLRIAEFIKRKSKGECAVIVGGHHASLTPEDFTTNFVDAIVIGEGEITFAEVVASLVQNRNLESVPGLALNRVDGKQFCTEPRSFVKNLDEFPLPARHLSESYRKQYFIGHMQPVAMVETARGCPYRCTFCSVHKFFRNTVRVKSAERIVKELARIIEDIIFFSDDNFLTDVRRAEKIAFLIKKNGIKKQYFIQARSDTIVKHPELIPIWKEIGLGSAFIGFEKIDQTELEQLKKGNTVENNEKALEILRSCGVGVVPSFIVEPSETHEGFAKLHRYIERLQLRTTQFSVLTPFPGTDLFEEVKEKIIYKKHELFDGLHAVLPTQLPLPDFYKEFSRLYVSVFERSEAGREGISQALNRFRNGQFSLSNLKKLVKTAKMATNPECYLAGHMEN